MDLLKRQLAFQEECLRAAKNAALEDDAAAAETQVARLRERIDKEKPPATQHELAHKRLKKARRELEELQEGAAKAREAQAAAAAVVIQVEAALQAKELQMVELEAAFTETARAALPATRSTPSAGSFTIAEEELDGRPELKEYCRDARFAQAMDILRAKADRSVQDAIALAADDRPGVGSQSARPASPTDDEDMELDDEAIASLATAFVESSEEEPPEQRKEKIEAAQKRLKAMRKELAGQLDGVRKRQKAAARGS
jgi:hypothetical protein